MAALAKLNDKSIKAALRGAQASGKAKSIGDGGGLVLEAQPSGAGWWRLRYTRADGSENRQSLGTYPAVTLALAREKRSDALKLLADGTDPSTARKAVKLERDLSDEVQTLLDAGLPIPGTFAFVAREWLATVHQGKVSEGHAATTRTRLERDVFPWLGHRPLNEIEAPELLDCLRRIEARGAIETAHRIKSACGQVFRYGIATGQCKRDPAPDLRDALRPVDTTRHHAAITDPAGVAALLRAMHSYQGHPVTRAALHLSALLLLRPGELRHMQWSWIDFDTATLTVPAEMMKRSKTAKANGIPHLVPLAEQAITLLTDLHALTGRGRFVFPSLLKGDRCMSENTVRGALRRMGYANDDMTAHGFRATARTLIAERLGIAAEIIEAQLAHSVADALGRAYNRTTFAEQRRDMMRKWADYLDQLREGAHILALAGKSSR